MRKHGSIWRRYRNEREFGEHSRRKAAWLTLLFRFRLVQPDVRYWWRRSWLYRFFSPLNLDIYRPPYRGSRLILDNLGIQINWKAMKQAAKDKAAKARGDTICKIRSFPAGG